jgi:DNA-binding transcriptional regulator GbsR (MarR family)
MTAQRTEFDQAEFIEHLGLQMEADGFPRIAGRLFGALVLAPREQSLDELADALDVSKASISLNARMLEQRGLLERVGHPGDRRDYYRVPTDLFRRTMQTRVARWRAFHDAIAAVRPWAAKRRPAVVERLDALEAAYQVALGVINQLLEQTGTGRELRLRRAGARG